jgi:hypothetical protein
MTLIYDITSMPNSDHVTLSPPAYTQQLTQTSNALVETPAFTEFLTGLWTRGKVILTVNWSQMRRHAYQRETRSDHIDELEESIRHNNLSYLYPMKASTTYDWETLRRLPPLAPAPRSLTAHIFDGGHRFAALRKINAQHGPLATWPVELFPEGLVNSNHHFHAKLMTYWAKIIFKIIPTSSEHIYRS